MTSDNDYFIKVLLIGKESIGKTIFTFRLTKTYSEFKEIPKDYIATIGVEFYSKTITINNKNIKYSIWDLSGQERFSSIIKSYYRVGLIFIIFYDSSDRDSFEKAKLYHNEIKITNEGALFILVSNKYEVNKKSVENKNIVSDEEALEFADENDIFFFHISSYEKYETRINELFKFISLKIIENNKFKKNTNCKVKKPIIYLYPEKTMDISVQLNIKESKLTTIYPKFNENNNTWKVYVNTNGEIKIKDKIYPYLFWEAESYLINEMNEGFIVKDDEAEKFLEDKLKILGLNDKESTDFITFWLPVLLKNKFYFKKNLLYIIIMLYISSTPFNYSKTFSFICFNFLLFNFKRRINLFNIKEYSYY